jgi:hypothetical protein
MCDGSLTLVRHCRETNERFTTLAFFAGSRSRIISSTTAAAAVHPSPAVLHLCHCSIVGLKRPAAAAAAAQAVIPRRSTKFICSLRPRISRSAQTTTPAKPVVGRRRAKPSERRFGRYRGHAKSVRQLKQCIGGHAADGRENRQKADGRGVSFGYPGYPVRWKHEVRANPSDLR